MNILVGIALASLLSLDPASRGGADLIRYRILNEALAQAERPGADWDPGQRDCAGLVRLLFRKAVGAHEPLWLRADGSRVPLLTADELLAYNFVGTARTPEPDRLETGDVLAFFDAAKPPLDAWHLMILLRPPGTAPDRLLVVYHNGATGREAAVRKVWLEDLREGPAEWRPDAENPRFLGTFRWRGFGNPAKESSR